MTRKLIRFYFTSLRFAFAARIVPEGRSANLPHRSSRLAGAPMRGPLGPRRSTCVVIGVVTVLCGCSGGSSSVDSETPNDPATGLSPPPDSLTAPGIDPSLFLSLADTVTTVSCTLSGGTQTTCHRIVVYGVPADDGVGPFCPKTITTGADDAGIWFDGGGDTYDLDGAFITNLATFYNDSNWLLYDPATGIVNVTDTLTACEGAARPNVDPQYQNHCVECELSYVNGGVFATFLLPTTPVPLPSPDNIGRLGVGVSLNGVVLAAPAPFDAILGAYTIAAFDDCGGHINPVDGYHYHAATGCTELVVQDDGHADLLGYSLDGYAIHGLYDLNVSEPIGLDSCRGHSDDVRGYHYHAASPGENLFIGCFSGEQGSVQ